jgi:hypothetical protein
MNQLSLWNPDRFEQIRHIILFLELTYQQQYTKVQRVNNKVRHWTRS